MPPKCNHLNKLALTVNHNLDEITIKFIILSIIFVLYRVRVLAQQPAIVACHHCLVGGECKTTNQSTLVIPWKKHEKLDIA